MLETVIILVLHHALVSSEQRAVWNLVSYEISVTRVLDDFQELPPPTAPRPLATVMAYTNWSSVYWNHYVYLSFCLSVQICPEDTFWTAQPFVTKLCMVMHGSEPEWHAKNSWLTVHTIGQDTISFVNL